NEHVLCNVRRDADDRPFVLICGNAIRLDDPTVLKLRNVIWLKRRPDVNSKQTALNQLLCETFVIEHNPNCPSPFLVRLIGKGKGHICYSADDICGYGKTLEEAATKAMKLAYKFPEVKTSTD